MAQDNLFNKSIWAEDKFGILGNRTNMDLPGILTDEFLFDAKYGAFDSLIYFIGAPDKLCFTEDEIIVFWYLEGYLNKKYYESADFIGKGCGEDLMVPNSFIVFQFSCDGRYVSSALIKEGG